MVCVEYRSNYNVSHIIQIRWEFSMDVIKMSVERSLQSFIVACITPEHQVKNGRFSWKNPMVIKKQIVKKQDQVVSHNFRGYYF